MAEILLRNPSHGQFQSPKKTSPNLAKGNHSPDSNGLVTKDVISAFDDACAHIGNRVVAVLM